MIIKQGMTDVSPLARGIATLAAHPAPVVSPPLPDPPPGAGVGLAPEARILTSAEIAEAMRNGMLSAPISDEDVDKQVGGAVSLALSALSRRPSGIVGITLFAAQLAGLATGLAAVCTQDPRLLKYAKRIQTGTEVAKGTMRDDLGPAAEVGLWAIIDATGRDGDRDLTRAARDLEGRPHELSAAVLDAAGVLAALASDDPAEAPTAPA